MLKYARSRVWPCESRCCVVAARDVAVVILLFPVWITPVTVNKMHGAEEEEHSTFNIEHVFYSVSVLLTGTPIIVIIAYYVYILFRDSVYLMQVCGWMNKTCLGGSRWIRISVKSQVSKIVLDNVKVCAVYYANLLIYAVINDVGLWRSCVHGIIKCLLYCFCCCYFVVRFRVYLHKMMN